MKKVLSILLSVVLLLTTLWSVLSVSMAASTGTDYFETPANWIFYKSSGTIGGTGSVTPAKAPRAETGTATYIREGGSSLYMSAHGYAPAIQLPDLELNKVYTLSFWYLAPQGSTCTSLKAWLNSVGIYKSGVSAVSSNAAIDTSAAVVMGPNGTGAGNLASDTAGDEVFYQYSITFETDEATGTDLYFAYRHWIVGYGTLYLDDFELEEVEAPKTDDAYFEDADNWYKLANMSTDIPADQSSWTQSKSGWCSLGEVSDSNVKSGNVALKYYGWLFPAYIPLKDLKANRSYTLSFYYKASGVNTTSGNPYIIADSGIYTTSPKIASGDTKVAGTSYNSDGYLLHRGNVTGYTNPTGDYSSGERKHDGNLCSYGAVAGEWNYIAYTFDTYDYTDLYFILHCKFPNSTSEFVYLDEFTLTENPVELADMTWKPHSMTTAVFGENGTAGGGTVTRTKEQNYTGTDEDGDVRSYKIAGAYAQYPATQISFEKNKYYNLTFYYYGTELDSSKGMFSHIKLVKEGGENADNTPDNLAYLDRNTCYYTNKNGAMIKLDGKVNTGVSTEAWNKVTLSFYSGDNTYAWLALRPTVWSAVYVDNFVLTETTELSKADQAVRLTWKSVSSGTTVFGANEKTAYGTFAEDETLVCPDAADDGYSNKLNPNNYAQYATTKIDGLEKDTYYYLTFYYYGAVLGSNNSMFSDVKVVKDGGTHSSATPDNLGYVGRTNIYYTNKNGLNAPMTGTMLANATANAWNKVVIPFYTGDTTTAWLALRHTASSTTDSTAPQNAAPIWVDGITVEKTTDTFPYIDEIPFAGWQGIPEEALINFDDYFVSVTPADRAEVTAAPAKDGKENNRALHFIPGVFDKAFRLNDGTINKDLVFTIPVEENSLYKFSYWIYVSEEEGSIPYFGFYYDFDSTWLLRSNNLQERGKWVKQEITFTTKPGMTQISLTINPGEIVRDIYVDDILVKRILPGVTGTAEDASYCDDFYDVIADQKLTKAIETAVSGVYKVAVEPNAQYTFAATVKSQKGSASKLWLSFDEQAGAALPISEAGAPAAVISSKGGESRYSYSIVTDKSGYLYIHIENDDGSMQLEDVQLFRTVSVSTNLPMGFETKPQTKLAVNTGTALNRLTLLGDLPAEDTTDTESPETGSLPIWPAVLIFVTTLALSVLTLKSRKGGEQA